MPIVYSGFTLKSLNLGENIINLGKNCLNIRKGVGTKLLKNKIKNKINLIKCESNYGLNVWDMTLNSKVDAFNSFTLEDSLPCAFAVSGEYRFGSFLNSLRKHRLYWARERTAEIGHRFIPYRSSLDFDDIAEPLKLKFFDTQSELAHGITMRFKRSITQSMHLMGKTMFNPDLALSSAITRSKIKTREFFVKRIHNSAKLSDLRSNMYYDALVAKDYFRALRRGRSYPMFDVAKRSTLLGHMYRSIRETVATTFIGDQYERHPAAQSLYLKKYLNTTINIERFEG